MLAGELREAGLATDRAFGGRSVKKQWGAAGKSGALHGVMLASREWERGHVLVKNMSTGVQEEVRRDEVVAWLLARQESEGR
ncbi:MAG: His/Gly/Thr/Pro-type tRNA ligase C-terminal domain-containing protein [Acidimicrobiia bacterium]|nr:His/Gly/Thr/Pro-type tRNA ligase C-terminal domain-containing protein [Acidimicrobiia bacterium]